MYGKELIKLKIMNNFKRIRALSLCLICCLICGQYPVIATYASSSWPVPEVAIEALAGVVMDMDSGAVLYEKDADTLYPPASTTKVLTALVVLENCENLDEVITFSKDAIERVEADSGNKIKVIEGDKMTVKDCLYALLLRSSNQAANALAEHVAGSIDDFVEMMNDKVDELGLTSSHFENPSGLNGDNHNVTARELAVISKEAYKNPVLLEISSSLSYKLPAMANSPDGRTIENEHRLLTTDEGDSYYFPAAKAGKTGYLIKAGNTLVTYAEQDGRRLVAVILKGTQRSQETDRMQGQYFIDTKMMMEFCFANFENYNILDYDQNTLSESELSGLAGNGVDPSKLSISDKAVLTLPKGAEFNDVTRNLQLELPKSHPNQAVALLEYNYHGKAVGKAYVINPEAEVEAESTPALPDSSGDDQIEPLRQAGDPGSDDLLNLPKGNSFLKIFFGILLVLIVGAVIALFINRRRKEAKQMEERRNKRKMRLREIGVSDEEFEEMVTSRKRNKE